MLGGRIEAGDFPSAVYIVAEHGHSVFTDALGDAVREPESRPATLETIYDLASLTKPLIPGPYVVHFSRVDRLTTRPYAFLSLPKGRPPKSSGKGRKAKGA